MPLTKPQKEVADDPARFKVAVCGRRWGKTFLSMNQIAKFGRYGGRKIFYVAPTYRQARQILWDDLKQKMLAVRWAKKINESELTIELVNGTKIYLRSADNPDSLRGISVDYLVMDECAMVDVKMWTEVLRPALSDRGGHALFITTPKGKANWIYDLWVGAKTRENWSAFSYTTLDGGNVPPEEIEMAKLDLDERSFKQEYEASFETYAGSIYYNFQPEQNVTPTLDPIGQREILHIGMDFNRTPLVAVMAKWNGNELHCFDEIQLMGSNTQEMCDEINNRYPNHRIWVWPDASGASHRTNSTKSDHNILRSAGFTIKSGRANPPVIDRIAAVNAGLLNASGEVRLTFDPKVKNMIRCISTQVYREGTRVPDKDSDTDHFNDALGYMVHGLMPIKRPVVERTGPDIWGHH